MRRLRDDPHAPPLETVLPHAAVALRDTRYRLAPAYTAAYRGKRDELTAAELAPEDGLFPGDPGAKATGRTFLRHGHRLQICVSSRAANPITYRVLAYRPRAASAAESDAPGDLPDALREQLEERERSELGLRELIDRGDLIGVVHREDAYGDEWIGRRDDLIDAGVCAAEHFPITPKRLWHTSYDENSSDGVAFRSTQAMKAGVYRHRVDYSREAIERRLCVRYRDANFARYTSPAYVKWAAETMLEAGTDACLRAMGQNKVHPDAAVYDRETIARVEQALEHARQILQASEPYVPKTVADRVRRAEVARADPAFRGFLNGLTTNVKRRAAS